MSSAIPEPVRVGTVCWDARGALPAQVRVIGDLVARWDLWSSHDHEVGLRFVARGPERHWGGELPMMRHLVDELVRTGAGHPGAAVAPGRLLSWAMCREARRRGAPLVVPDHHAARVRGRLPVSVLAEPDGPAPVDPSLVERLVRLGLRSLGDVVAVPIADLVGRFGEPGRQVHQWASGLEPPFVTAAPHTEVSVDQELEPPAQQLDAVVFVGRRLAEDLDDRLRRRGEVATAVCITFDTEHGERIERVWSHSEGLRPAALVDRVRWQLQGWQVGPVGLVRLTAVEARADEGRQSGWWGGEAHGDERAARAVARVAGLVGDQAVHRVRWCGGRDPVDRYERLPVAQARCEHAAVLPTAPWPGGLPAPSPARLFREPVPVDVRDASDCTVHVSGRGDMSAEPARVVWNGTLVRDIVAWAGPWPLDEWWWRPAAHRRRARLHVVTDDGSAWLVYRQHGQWWLQAQYS